MNGNYEQFKNPVDRAVEIIHLELKPGEKADMQRVNEVLDQLKITGSNRNIIAVKVGDKLFEDKLFTSSFSKLKPSEIVKQSKRNAYERRDHLLEQ